MAWVHKVQLTAVLGATLLAFGCRPAGDQTNLAAPRYGTWGMSLPGMDKSAGPGDDFFRYSAGKAFDDLKIPADRASWGPAEQLTELSDARLRAIIEDASHAWMPKGEQAQVGAVYNSFMDEKRVEDLDAKPLAGDLAKVRAADTRPKLAAVMGEGLGSYYGMLFAPFVGIDQRAPDHYVTYINSDGLDLPDRDYYLDPKHADDLKAYRAYIVRTLTMVGWAEPEKNADNIIAYETRIAQATWPREQRRDDIKMYNASTPQDLNTLTADFPWADFLRAARLDGQQKVVLGELSSFPAIAKAFAETDIPTLQAWQAFTMTDQASPYLSKRFVDSRFEFRNKTLNGIQELRPRYKRGVAAVNMTLGEAVGRLYVAKYFPPESKAKMVTLVNNLKSALKTRLQNASWMAPETRIEAQRKLEAINVKIGYPDKWRDYSALRIDARDLYGNVRRSLAFEWDYQRNKLGKPIDRLEWGMTPQTVNAYYDSTLNEVVFPAAILQPPYFDPDADLAVNYGSIGAVIGHEITHGFDDQGRHSDATGLLRDWWTPEDSKRYDAQASILGAQFNAYEPVPGHKINGGLTMGENIADLGGILIALDAYHAALGGKPAPVIDGLTGDQRFFLAYGQSWLDKKRDAAIIQQLASDPHSPDAYRVNGTLPNVDAWYTTFGIKPGNKLYVAPEKRAHIW